MKLHLLEKFLMNNSLRTWIQRNFEAPRVFEGVELPQDSFCLEIGCGRGVGAILINKHFNPKRVYAIDYDRDMIERANRYFAKPPKWAFGTRMDNIELKVADATDLPFPDNYFDAVFAFGVFHHIENWQRAIFEVYRVLKPGGYFSFEELFFQNIVFRVIKRFGPLSYIMILENEFNQTLKNTGFMINSYKRAWFILPHCHTVVRKG